MRASAVEAAKFVGTHVRRVAPTAAAWAHRHCAFFYVALRPRRRDDLLGTGTEWEGDRVIGSTAETARKRPERP